MNRLKEGNAAGTAEPARQCEPADGADAARRQQRQGRHAHCGHAAGKPHARSGNGGDAPSADAAHGPGHGRAPCRACWPARARAQPPRLWAACIPRLCVAALLNRSPEPARFTSLTCPRIRLIVRSHNFSRSCLNAVDRLCFWQDACPYAIVLVPGDRQAFVTSL